ncbi:MAG TPA: hypothetical protein PLD88_00600, partial [Candidatus Berkiella sp.]|nr:hypothetical protein [Candidatus Berkiella sp.]
FSQPESQIIERFKEIAAPQSYSLAEIRGAYQYKSVDDVTALPTFTIVEGVSANDLHHRQIGGNSVLQVASQFDFQEAPGPMEINVEQYIGDPTQGPQASIEAGAAAMHRKAAKRSGNLDHALSELIPKSMLKKSYRDGYLDLSKLDDAEKSQLLEHIEK